MQCPYLHRKQAGMTSAPHCTVGPGDGEIGSRCMHEGYNYCRLYLDRSLGGNDGTDSGPPPEPADGAAPPR